jgi:tetratricopeptide (TPR) repeat protein
VNNLAVTFNRIGNYERSVQEAREAIRRAPDQGPTRSNLAYALRGLNRFDEARAAANEAVNRKIETLPTRLLLYQLAILRGDTQDAERHLAWAEGRPRGFDLIGARAQVAAHAGRWTEARELYRTTVDMARAAGLAEVADAYTAQAAWAAAVLGYTDEARSGARRVLNASPQVALAAAAVLAQAGDSAGVMQRIDDVLKVFPRDTQLVDVLGPMARGAVLLAAGRPKEALDGLRRALPYDYGRMAALRSLYIRGQAFTAAGDHAAAINEFKRLHEHRGAEPFAIFDAVVPLERGRAEARAGNGTAAAQSYDDFLRAFAQADPNLPLLQKARAERAALDAPASASR